MFRFLRDHHQGLGRIYIIYIKQLFIKQHLKLLLTTVSSYPVHHVLDVRYNLSYVHQVTLSVLQSSKHHSTPEETLFSSSKYRISTSYFQHFCVHYVVCGPLSSFLDLVLLLQ